MQFKNVQSFIKGAFEKEGIEARISDQCLILLQNAEVDITGRIKSRYGYEYWIDLLDDNSTTSSQNIPVVEGDNNIKSEAGFRNRIQKIFQYISIY